MQLYQLALWHGYGLHLQQFTSVKITDITDVDHFMACFFSEGFDADQDAFAMKVGCGVEWVQCVSVYDTFDCLIFFLCLHLIPDIKSLLYICLCV